MHCGSWARNLQRANPASLATLSPNFVFFRLDDVFYGPTDEQPKWISISLSPILFGMCTGLGDKRP